MSEIIVLNCLMAVYWYSRVEFKVGENKHNSLIRMSYAPLQMIENLCTVGFIALP